MGAAGLAGRGGQSQGSGAGTVPGCPVPALGQGPGEVAGGVSLAEEVAAVWGLTGGRGVAQCPGGQESLRGPVPAGPAACQSMGTGQQKVQLARARPPLPAGGLRGTRPGEKPGTLARTSWAGEGSRRLRGPE